MRNIVVFDRTTEMAWYVLRQFINPLDCSSRFGDAIIPLNKSENLERLYNGEPFPDGSSYRPSYFSRCRLHLHLNHAETYYYRCRYNAVAQVGYGSYDGAKDKLDFAADMGIEGKVQKFGRVGVMLLGIDIDAHNGEPDAPAVRDMLLDLFPGSYSEPSTSGRGIHFYLKLAYRRDYAGDAHRTLQYVHRVMADLGHLLDRRRVEAGLAAQIDKVRGLPSLIGIRADGRIKIHNRSICIKIPRFDEGEEGILKLHYAPYVDFAGVDRLVKEQKAADLLEPTSEGDQAGDALVRFMEADPESFIPYVQGQESGAGGICSNSVGPEGYCKQIAVLRKKSDAYTRGFEFALAYARHLKRVPAQDELLREYEVQRLNTGQDDDGNRTRRFAFIHQYLSKTFDPQSLGFSYDGFEAAQPALEEFLRSRLRPGVQLTYNKVTTRPISIGELTRAYYALLQSQGLAPATEFSVRMLKRAFKTMTGEGVCDHKARRLLQILRDDLRLIRQVGGYINGVRGRVWEVVRPLRGAAETTVRKSSVGTAG